MARPKYVINEEGVRCILDENKKVVPVQKLSEEELEQVIIKKAESLEDPAPPAPPVSIKDEIVLPEEPAIPAPKKAPAKKKGGKKKASKDSDVL